MSNHVQLIISAKGSNVSNVLEDFKKFTSKQILKVIIEHAGKAEDSGCSKCLRAQERLIEKSGR